MINKMDFIKRICGLLCGNLLDELNKISTKHIRQYIPADFEENFELAKKWSNDSGLRLEMDNAAKLIVNNLMVDTMIFNRCSGSMNQSSAEWFIERFSFIPENGLAMVMAFSHNNVNFIDWHLSKFQIRDKWEQTLVERICSNQNPDDAFLRLMLCLIAEHGSLQHYRMKALEIAVDRMDDATTEFILRECTFTDAEIESINELPEKYRPLGPKCAIK